ncbi:hypothetical protein N7466_009638 [Penicillium verhagenii]|uniref:uncharacterized protein n=1 Tax=Penicillium verhagenii TaxID=1562060 RepID=UPI002544E500|nr:uncharacterized protein N7466_009638 [Penicillium verhagenii]KAJ5921312.1 hypothetical protein N7466_009638 [Penicillium verhagenii]
MVVPGMNHRLFLSMKTLGLALGKGFLRVYLSLTFLILDNCILFATILLARFRFRSKPNRRQEVLKNVHFYPKTVLITGIGTPQGLALARAWDAEGHRVVGVDVADLDLPVRSGGGMSKTLVAFYRVRKDHYLSRILDIIQREKVDVWIPCSPKASAMEDATARQVVENRTNCKCIAFDTEMTACFRNTDAFRLYLAEKKLPMLEYHQVQSRDSIHKILHRSPTKSYNIRRLSSEAPGAAVILPQRTLSKTYSEVSEIQISKDSPWVLQQQTRLGEFFADVLVVRGYVHAIKVRLAESRSPHWGASPLDEALAKAVHQLMQTFAEKGGARMTGHLSVRLLVDEEFDTSSVRHTIHIADCVPGALALENLLRDARCPVRGYLSVLSQQPIEPASWNVPATLSPSPRSRPTIIDRDLVSPFISIFVSLDFAKRVLAILEAELVPFLFWKDEQFSLNDPLPWWWHVHVYQPLREIWQLMKQTRAAGLTANPFAG